MPEIDLGLRRAAGLQHAQLPMLDKYIQPRVIYRILDPFGCRYFALRMPEDQQILLAGPYLHGIAEPLLLSWSGQHRLSSDFLSTMRRYYSIIPTMDDDTPLTAIMTAMGEMLWGSADAFTFENYESAGAPDHLVDASTLPHITHDEMDIQAIETRYENESRLIHAVSQGMVHQASLMFTSFHPNMLEKRTGDSLRNLKNYAIVLNVLLRKAAQQGNVHPLYIDQLSSSIARRIEQLPSIAEGQKYLQTMVHKYCLLVKNHTMRGYSQPVQSVILRVDADLTANLTLQAHATHLGINASYLSSLFKRETGMTLTEYVNRKRIDNAIFLLNTTSLQIQAIAQHCGIPDVNYFTKTFKRLIGQTPSEYRQMTHGLGQD